MLSPSLPLLSRVGFHLLHLDAVPSFHWGSRGRGAEFYTGGKPG